MIRTLLPDSTRSLMISIVPNTARPMRAVRPTILPLRLRIALMRWSVRSMPARLSSPNEPMWSMTYWMSSSVTSRSSSTSSPPPPKRASGARPRSITTSIRSRSAGSARSRSPISGGRATSSASRSSGAGGCVWSAACVDRPSFGFILTSAVTKAGSRHALGVLLHQQRDARRSLAKPLLLEAPIERRFVGSHRADHAAIGPLRRARSPIAHAFAPRSPTYRRRSDRLGRGRGA